MAQPCRAQLFRLTSRQERRLVHGDGRRSGIGLLSFASHRIPKDPFPDCAQGEVRVGVPRILVDFVLEVVMRLGLVDLGLSSRRRGRGDSGQWSGHFGGEARDSSCVQNGDG